MRMIKVNSAAAFAAAGADWISEHLRERPAASLALPTGRTPLPVYAELTARARVGDLDVGALRLFNLDDYVGLPAADPRSYAAFMQYRVVEPLGLSPLQVRLLKGDAADLETECRAYDAAVAAAGGIHLCILGLGENGHIAFNEPGADWTARTRVVVLSESTRATHARQSADGWSAPPRGITMGIRTILESRHILLLVAGERKESARAALQRGRADPDWPVTSLLDAADVTVLECSAPWV